MLTYRIQKFSNIQFLNKKAEGLMAQLIYLGGGGVTSHIDNLQSESIMVFSGIVGFRIGSQWELLLFVGIHQQLHWEPSE